MDTLLFWGFSLLELSLRRLNTLSLLSLVHELLSFLLPLSLLLSSLERLRLFVGVLDPLSRENRLLSRLLLRLSDLSELFLYLLIFSGLSL